MGTFMVDSNGDVNKSIIDVAYKFGNGYKFLKLKIMIFERQAF